MSTTLNKIKVGIVGGSGYTGGELVRLIINHPKSELLFVHSKINSGKYIYEIHPNLEQKYYFMFNYMGQCILTKKY